MRQFSILILFFAFSISLNAQAWTDVGLKAGWGTSWLLNGSIFDDNSYTHQYSFGYNFGLKAGVNIGEHSGFTFDYIISKLEQEFLYTLNDTEFSNTIEWDNHNLYLLYRQSRQGAYFEIGPMLSMVKKVKQTDTGTPILNTNAPVDVTPFYSDNYLSGVIGGGAFLAGGDNATLMLGMRIHYAFQDFISDQGQGSALLVGGQELPFAFPNPNRGDLSVYDDYKQTNPLFIQVLLELNFGLGYFAKTVCSGRVKWFSGRN